MQGHVDGTGRVLWQRREGDSLIVAYTAPVEVAPYLVPKGSVTVDGVSLTVVDCSPTQFTVALIPHTLAVTRFDRLTTGDRVNLEADVLAKYVAKALEVQQSGAMRSPGCPGSLGGSGVKGVPTATIEEALTDYRRGRMVIIVDDEQRENEGDLALPATHVTPEAINFMATHGRGLICTPMTGERLDELQDPAH